LTPGSSLLILLESLLDVYHWIAAHAIPEGSRVLSALEVRSGLSIMFPGFEVSSDEEMRALMTSLSFVWDTLHPNHYLVISNRRDVQAHRLAFVPRILAYWRAEKVALVFSDGSFIYENAFSNSGWRALADPDSNLVNAGTGKGRRINTWDFITERGLLRHPDGGSAGTLFPAGFVLDHNSILQCLERGIAAIQAYTLEVGATLPVLVMDGAKINKTMPEDAINPSKVHLDFTQISLIF
jgi:hypothetical protein